jgi:hypothetical protein
MKIHILFHLYFSIFYLYVYNKWIYISVPPVVLQSVGHTVASKGDAVVIPCGIYSDPDPTITWYKGNWISLFFKYVIFCSLQTTMP